MQTILKLMGVGDADADRSQIIEGIYPPGFRHKYR